MWKKNQFLQIMKGIRFLIYIGMTLLGFLSSSSDPCNQKGLIICQKSVWLTLDLKKLPLISVKSQLDFLQSKTSSWGKIFSSFPFKNLLFASKEIENGTKNSISRDFYVGKNKFL